MKVTSILRDERIDAFNVLIEISVAEYLSFAKNIVDNNEYQRKRVIKSKIKEILKEDLLRNCLIPSIVLAATNETIVSFTDDTDFKAAELIINESIKSEEILIIDGLQRTYVLLDLESDLKSKNDSIQLQKLYAHKIRAEVYLGLNRVGLLYRMITLNTGQTTMSTRHLMEILYFDYARLGVDGIKLTKDKDDTKIEETTNEYNFKTVLDGFNSYLEKDESLIDRTEILDNIKSLEVIKREETNKDLFKDFLLGYKKFLDIMVEKTNDWKFDKEKIDSDRELKTNPFGKTTLDIFKKSQVLTGYGAALGTLKDDENVSLQDIGELFDKIHSDEDWEYTLSILLKQLDLIKEKSKKIGNDQRYYFRSLFRGLFDKRENTYLNFKKSLDYAYDRTRREKEYK